ncbi:VPS10 domain-containing protein [Aquimarina intermedia]|uniref:Sortilin (Neurotensin receptor 3) n=1 Tax=Aquimarina intermedia TaxID=350814 RepID=A0A5S5CC73_9FLAO|nr:glycosyl hydrolase [Aquimarina intermedia]TYP76964.1 sortilin (neurotensin receptor 3) [Aquimarina intermedia]
MKLNWTATLLMTLVGVIQAQQPSTSAQDQQQALIQKQNLQKTSLVKNIPFENIGPSVMSGRVVDIAVNPKQPTEFYVGYASGGLWYTNNNGTTFSPVLDTAETINVGDIAVHWESGTLWVGTGENNASRSSYAGTGILKSEDKGKTWKNVGLTDSHHIGRIVINAENPDEVIVGVAGHLYSANEERGIYKTVDGGKTWKKTLFIDEKTGIIDVAVAPQNFKIQYASTWQRDRKAWNFKGNGEGSAIYKSIDAGDTWTKISTETSGFPVGDGVGRIGIAVFDENTVYAVHDNQNRRKVKEEKGDTKSLTKEDFKTMSVEVFLEIEDKKLNAYLKRNGFQEKYRAENVKHMVRGGTVKPIDLAKYLENANAALFDTPVIGAEVYRSDDGGTSWKKTHEDYLDDIFYSYGYYFAQIQVNPSNKEHIYISGVPIVKSKDGGKTFESISAENVHADHHALWINPENPKHLINGNDGGVNITYDDGYNWLKANQPSVGQFYAIQVDNEEPYNIYGGLQDNGVWVGSSTAEEDVAWHQNGQYPWESIMGGDGMQVQVDTRNADIVYTGFQFGNYYRLNRATGESTYIQPKHELGESRYRFNWQTPILLSPHNQDILYLGGNKLMRSMNQGTDWQAISKDLTGGGKKGNVAYGTLTAISESPFHFGLLYTGSDDGFVYRSDNAGGSWTLLSKDLPNDLWVSRIVASQHAKDRVYVTLNGYRWDDFTPYVYRSEDRGATWTAIGNSIPMSPVNVIIEDPKNEDVVYVGTDNGAYVSFDRGNSWETFSKGLPPVAVHDMVIQSKSNDLLIGTHGRSIYRTNVEPLQGLTNALTEPLHIFPISDITYSKNWGNSWSKWLAPKTPGTLLKVYSKKPEELVITINTKEGKKLYEFTTKADRGLTYVPYDLSIPKEGKKVYEKEYPDDELTKRKNEKYYLPVGTYQVQITNGATVASEMFEIK